MQGHQGSRVVALPCSRVLHGVLQKKRQASSASSQEGLPDLEEAGEGHREGDGPIPGPLPVHDCKVQNGPPYHARVQLAEVLQVKEAMEGPRIQLPPDEEVIDGVACSQQ